MVRYKPKDDSLDDFDRSIGQPFNNSADRELFEEREKRRLKWKAEMEREQEDDFDKGFMYREY